MVCPPETGLLPPDMPPGFGPAAATPPAARAIAPAARPASIRFMIRSFSVRPGRVSVARPTVRSENTAGLLPQFFRRPGFSPPRPGRVVPATGGRAGSGAPGWRRPTCSAARPPPSSAAPRRTAAAAPRGAPGGTPLSLPGAAPPARPGPPPGSGWACWPGAGRRGPGCPRRAASPAAELPWLIAKPPGLPPRRGHAYCNPSGPLTPRSPDMIPSTLSATPAAPTEVWAAVGDHLEAFARAWEAGGPPDLAAHLPPG